MNNFLIALLGGISTDVHNQKIAQITKELTKQISLYETENKNLELQISNYRKELKTFQARVNKLNNIPTSKLAVDVITVDKSILEINNLTIDYDIEKTAHEYVANNATEDFIQQLTYKHLNSIAIDSDREVHTKKVNGGNGRVDVVASFLSYDLAIECKRPNISLTSGKATEQLLNYANVSNYFFKGVYNGGYVYLFYGNKNELMIPVRLSSITLDLLDTLYKNYNNNIDKVRSAILGAMECEIRHALPLYEVINYILGDTNTNIKPSIRAWIDEFKNILGCHILCQIVHAIRYQDLIDKIENRQFTTKSRVDEFYPCIDMELQEPYLTYRNFLYSSFFKHPFKIFREGNRDKTGDVSSLK